MLGISAARYGRVRRRPLGPREKVSSLREEVLVPGVELLESMRSVGYSFEAAIADIVDNSITAEASAVDIVVDPIDADYVWVLDDGAGMDGEDARGALRLAGTRSHERSATDLGRFGLGLKTASLSQARRLTVVTKKVGGPTTGLQWDLDHVAATGAWAIKVLEEDDISGVPGIERFSAQAKGTLVVWQTLDYLLAGAADPAALVAERLEALREHLGFTFQRFLDARRSKLEVTVNGKPVEALDPFLSGKPRTQISPEERITVAGEQVVIQAYTLPHQSAFTAADRRRTDLGIRMRDLQGFYVYRNDRLISRGGWFGLHKIDELSKQSRVRVEIPNSLDHLWQLDIKKSRVEPPQAFRTRFRQIIDQVVGSSRRVHRFRGRAESEPETVFLWQRVNERDGYRYTINLAHPLIVALRTDLTPQKAELLDRVLHDVATTFPASDLYVQMAENARQLAPESDNRELAPRLRAIRDSGGGGASPADMTRALRHVEPFDSIAELEELIAEVWEEERS